MSTGGSLLAISDLHVGYPQNRAHVANLRPGSTADWLIIAGDVAEQVADVAWTLEILTERFARVIWVAGNHELWTMPGDPYPVWPDPAGGVTIAPLFILGVVCTDELVLHPDPYESRDAWCDARVTLTEQRLAALDPGTPVVLVNHHPLVREPLRYPPFALWCGTRLTADWHRRFNAVAVVYGHLHLPRTTWHDGVPFMEVSVGYPREWGARGGPPEPCQVLPRAEA